MYKKLFTTIWKYSKGMHVKLVLTYTMFVMSNVLLMLEPYFLGKFFNVIQEGGDNVLKGSAFYLGIFVVIALLFWVFHGPARVMERSMSYRMTQNFVEDMFNKVTKLPLKWHRDNHSGKTINKINKASQALREFMEEGYVYLETIIPFLASLIAIIVIMKLDGLYVLLFAGLAIFIITRFDKFLIWSLTQLNKKEHKIASTLHDYVSNITTVITLRLGKLAKNELIGKISAAYPLFQKRSKINEIKWFVVDMIVTAAWFFTLFLYVYRSYTMDGVVMIGTLVMLHGYVDKFLDVFYGIAWKYERFVMTATNLATVDSLITAHDKFAIGHPHKKVNRRWRKIEIRNLFFKHEDEKKHIHTLENINLDLIRGKKIAFIGESGSGKSTLMTILRGLVNANQLDLKIDGKEFNDLRILSSFTTLIPQDPEIFENTIGYNVTMGIPCKKSSILKAIKVACFDKVLKKMPEGLKTDIREKGVNMSGGEKQRLALARGVFASKYSDLVLMDEPTSSVDSKNELQIYENLFKNFKGKCVVSSIHNHALLKLFDIVYEFEKGEIKKVTRR